MVERQSNSSSRAMSVSSRGRKKVKDMHDLFATLVVSLDLKDHRQFFKSYSFSFTTDDACYNLSALKFAQSNRVPDPKNPRRIITTTTTTTFLMNREIAKATCQEFLDARLISNAAEPGQWAFRERGVWKCTPKGLAVLDRFITANGISSPELARLFGASENRDPPRLVYLERRTETDELYLNRQSVISIWSRFAGARPNELVAATSASVLASNGRSAPTPSLSAAAFVNRPLTSTSRSSLSLADEPRGIALRKYIVRSKSGKEQVFEHCTPALAVLDWLVERSSVATKEEAADVAAQFVRWGFLSLAQDKGRTAKESDIVAQYTTTDEKGLVIEGEFRGTERAVYHITEKGARAAGWHSSPIDQEGDFTPPPSTASTVRGRTARQSNSHVPGSDKASVHLQRLFESNSSSSSVSSPSADGSSVKEPSTLKLQHILADPSLRKLFKAYLRSCFCEENLAFVLEVQDFKRRFAVSSSAVASPATRYVKDRGSEMDYHTQDLIERAFWIYNMYLAPHSPAEVNVEHVVRADITSYVQTHLAEAALLAKRRHEQRKAYAGGPTMSPSQLQTMLVLFERVQGLTYRLMANDSVPKFIKTDAFVDHLLGEPTIDGGPGRLSPHAFSIRNSSHTSI